MIYKDSMGQRLGRVNLAKLYPDPPVDIVRVMSPEQNQRTYTFNTVLRVLGYADQMDVVRDPRIMLPLCRATEGA